VPVGYWIGQSRGVVLDAVLGGPTQERLQR
jgi:hypothetical protein